MCNRARVIQALLAIALALGACATVPPCTQWVPQSDAWCECMWSADSTYFTEGHNAPEN